MSTRHGAREHDEMTRAAHRRLFRSEVVAATRVALTATDLPRVAAAYVSSPRVDLR